MASTISRCRGRGGLRSLSVFALIAFAAFHPGHSAAGPVRTPALLDDLCRSFTETLREARYVRVASSFTVTIGGVDVVSAFELEFCGEDWSFAKYETPRSRRAYYSRADSTWTFDLDHKTYCADRRIIASLADRGLDGYDNLFAPPFGYSTLVPILAPGGRDTVVSTGLDTLLIGDVSVPCEVWENLPGADDGGANLEEHASVKVWRAIASGAILRSQFEPHRALPVVIDASVTALQIGRTCRDGTSAVSALTEFERVLSLDRASPGRHSAERAASPMATIDSVGNEIAIRPWESGPIMVVFWATWCAPCRYEIDGLSDLSMTGARERSIYFVSREDTRKQQRVLSSLPAEIRTIQDNCGDIFRAYGVSRIPTVILIDSSGTIVREAIGVQSYASLSHMLGDYDELISSSTLHGVASHERRN